MLYSRKKRNSFTTKPDWCPLKPVPEKFSDFEDIVKAKSDNAYEVGLCMYNRGTIQGYNSCIDKILKDRESVANETVRNG